VKDPAAQLLGISLLELGSLFRVFLQAPAAYASAASLRFSSSSAALGPGTRERGTLEKARQMAAHTSTRTTPLYDRREDRVTLDEVVIALRWGSALAAVL
jgi:hypothetical protein